MNQHNNIKPTMNQHKSLTKRPRKFRRLIKYSSDDSSVESTIYFRSKEEIQLPIHQHLASITKKLEVKKYDYSKPTLDDDDIEDTDAKDVVDLTSNQDSST